MPKLFRDRSAARALHVGRSVHLRLTVASGRVAECCLEPTLRAVGVQILTPSPPGGNEWGAARRADRQAASLRRQRTAGPRSVTEVSAHVPSSRGSWVSCTVIGVD